MNRFKTVAIGCFAVAIASSALVWHRYHHAGVSGDMELDVRQMVVANPDLEPLFDEAMRDGVLSLSDVEQIVTVAESMDTEAEQ